MIPNVFTKAFSLSKCKMNVQLILEQQRCELCMPTAIKLKDTWSLEEKHAAKSLQSCPTLCDPIDGSPPGSPKPGILQTRTVEWVAISFSSARK